MIIKHCRTHIERPTSTTCKHIINGIYHIVRKSLTPLTHGKWKSCTPKPKYYIIIITTTPQWQKIFTVNIEKIATLGTIWTLWKGKGGFPSACIPERIRAVGWCQLRRMFDRIIGIAVGNGFCECLKFRDLCVWMKMEGKEEMRRKRKKERKRWKKRGREIVTWWCREGCGCCCCGCSSSHSWRGRLVWLETGGLIDLWSIRGRCSACASTLNRSDVTCRKRNERKTLDFFFLKNFPTSFF